MRNKPLFFLLSAFLSASVVATEVVTDRKAETIAFKKAAQPASLEVLSKIIDVELQQTKESLDKNSLSSMDEIESLKAKLDIIWGEIKLNGFTEKKGLDSEWRPAFATLQGVIEKAQAIALKDKKLSSAVAYIVTPRMPTPLMLDSGKKIEEIKISKVGDFAALRNTILKRFMKAGGVINSIYSSDAYSVLKEELPRGLKIYKANLAKYGNNIKDNPSIKLPMKFFPPAKTGAIYLLDGKDFIAIQSYQLNQIDLTSTLDSVWAIRFGTAAKPRVDEVKKFIKDESGLDLIP